MSVCQLIITIMIFVDFVSFVIIICFSSGEDCSHLPMSVCQPTEEGDNLVRSRCQVLVLTTNIIFMSTIILIMVMINIIKVTIMLL